MAFDYTILSTSQLRQYVRQLEKQLAMMEPTDPDAHNLAYHIEMVEDHIYLREAVDDHYHILSS